MIYVTPSWLYFATVVDAKGPDATLAQRIARWIKEVGLLHYTYNSDREIALRALLRQASLMAGIPEDQTAEDNDPDSDVEDMDIRAAVPEESAPGESQSNAAAERAARSVEDQVRTMKLALEARLSCKIPTDHIIMRWLVEHAAVLLTNFHYADDDGKSGYERLHGHRDRHRIPEFGGQ